MRCLIALLVLGGMTPALAAIDPYAFSDPTQEARYKGLTNELRCPKCQNQAVSDSNAPLSADFRQKVYEMIKDNRSDTEIVDYFVTRYGEFVTYNPPLRPGTFLLWFGPILLMFGGLAGVALWVARRHQRPNTLTDAERARLQQLLGEERP